MNYIKNIHDGIWQRVIRSSIIEDSVLGGFRIVLGLLTLAFFIHRYGWIGEMPQSVFDPHFLSISNLFSAFPGKLYFLIGESVILITISLITLGIRSRLNSFIFIITYFLLSSFSNSFGKIDHDVLFPAIFFCMLFSNWGSYFALLPDRKRTITLRGEVLLAIIISFGMFTAGFQKALNWIDFDMAYSGFLRWYYNGYFSLGRTELLADYVLLMPQYIIEFFDYFAVLLEFTPFIALLMGRKYWKLWLMIAAVFHLGNLLLLNISFSFHILVYLPFILVIKTRSISLSSIQKWILITTVMILLLINMYITWIIPESKSIIRIIAQNQTESILYIYLFLWSVFIIYGIFNFRQNLKITV